MARGQQGALINADYNLGTCTTLHNTTIVSMQPAAASALAFAVAFGLFGTSVRLGGPLLYDDKAAVLRNPVVIGTTPLSQVWVLDFWGEHTMEDMASHKSYRPLVTLSYAANYALHQNDPWGFHLVNALLHGLISALSLPVALYAWRFPPGQGTSEAAYSALLFAAHPVHVEAVQNIVGRAELMMSFFYLGGFLLYCLALPKPPELLTLRACGGIVLALAATVCAVSYELHSSRY